MSAYNQTTLALAVIIGGTGIAAVLIGLAWCRVVSPDNLDRDTVFFLVKLFGGITLVMMLFMLVARYG